MGPRLLKSSNKRKRPRRGPTPAVRRRLHHFTEDYEKNGNNYLLCNYCMMDYARKLQAHTSGAAGFAPVRPKAMHQRADNLERHLTTCVHFKCHKQNRMTGEPMSPVTRVPAGVLVPSPASELTGSHTCTKLPQHPHLLRLPCQRASWT